MPSLDYYSLAEAFFRFKKVAAKYNFYPEEIYRMEQSIKEMNPLQEDPELITKQMRGAKNYDSV